MLGLEIVRAKRGSNLLFVFVVLVDCCLGVVVMVGLVETGVRFGFVLAGCKLKERVGWDPLVFNCLINNLRNLCFSCVLTLILAS